MDLYIFIVNIISYFFLMIFLYHYNRLRYSKIVSIVTLIGLWASMVGIEWQRYLIEGKEVTTISLAALLLQAVMIMLASAYLSEYQDWRTIFSGFMSTNYILLGKTTVLVIIFLTNNRIAGFVLGIIVYILVFSLMQKYLHDAYMLVFDKVNLHWNAWCFIPILFYFIYFTSTTYPSSIIETPTNMVTAVLTSIVMIVFYSVLFLYMKNIYDQQEIESKMMLMDAFANGVRIQAETVQKSENEVRILRHDLKHLLNLVSIMLDQEEYDRAKELLEQYAAPDMKNIYRTFCANTVVNGILNTVLMRGKKAGLDVRIRASVPEKIEIVEMDVALVISNLADNAIRSVKNINNMDDRWLEISVRLVDDKLIIETKNPFVGKIDFDSETGYPKTKRGKNHGFGIQSVGAVAWKYNGLTDFSTEENIFVTRVMLSNISIETQEEI